MDNIYGHRELSVSKKELQSLKELKVKVTRKRTKIKSRQNPKQSTEILVSESSRLQ
jgi:hypothetical protein